MPQRATEFTVHRSRWLRGNRDHDGRTSAAYLRNPWGEMCCMGFYALACGLTEERITGEVTLSGVGGLMDSIERSLSPDGGRTRVYGLNDSCALSDPERERRIADELAAVGVTVHFED